MISDLISRSALLEIMNAVVFRNVPVEHQPYIQAAWETFEAVVKTVPAVDAEPVRHGRWIKTKNRLARCSECDSVQPYDANGDDVIYWPCRYCPNCGAKMDAKEE